MTLRELYAQIPSGQHGDIVVAGDRVFRKTEDGVEEYALLPDGTLALLRSDRSNLITSIRADLAAIKAKLGI